jgi:hypothetical protein
MFRIIAMAAILAGSFTVQAATATPSSPAARPATDETHCGAGFKWGQFSALDMTVHGAAGNGPATMRIHVALRRYADGQRLVFEAGDQRSEVVTLNRPAAALTLASDAQAPFRLAEIGTVFEIPVDGLQQQFRDPCELAPGVRYPLALRAERPGATGEFTRDGDSIRFVIREAGGRRQLTHFGTIGYASVERNLPIDLAIRGWTIFGSSIRPADGRPSPFGTLGEFKESLSKVALP